MVDILRCLPHEVVVGELGEGATVDKRAAWLLVPLADPLGVHLCFGPVFLESGRLEIPDLIGVVAPCARILGHDGRTGGPSEPEVQRGPLYREINCGLAQGKR